MKLSAYILFGVLFLGHFTSFGEVSKSDSSITKNQNKVLAGCAQSTSQAILEINNVRTILHNGGDMWWTIYAPSAPRYEIPKQNNPSIPKKHSLFAGSIWLGGVDANTQELLMIASTYRQSSYSLFPGALNVNNGQPQITPSECNAWDQHFKVRKSTIDSFLIAYQNGLIQSPSQIPASIRLWPGKGNPYLALEPGFSNMDLNRPLAPFDEPLSFSPDGIYDPLNGDVPRIKGDEGIWWVMNDAGNQKYIAGIAGALPIGMEVQVMAYGYATNDALNDMTFYDYTLLNKGQKQLNDTYLGQWVDADVGFAFDDFVGFEVERGMAYTYNADAFDEGIAGYGNTPPAVGIDIICGPKADLDTIGDGIDNDGDGLIDESDNGYAIYEGDGIDNDRDGLVDEADESILISNFMYYNNIPNVIYGEPNSIGDFYNYLRSNWRDGSPLTYGASGLNPSAPVTSFAFPGQSDLAIGWGLGGTFQQPYSGINNIPWVADTAYTIPQDARMVLSAGAFTMMPGAQIDMTIGVPWARGTDNLNSVSKLFQVDDLIDGVCDNQFVLQSDLEAPNLAVEEMENEVVLSWEPSEFTTLNAGFKEFQNTESFEQFDNQTEGYYKFQGYLVYQLANNEVSVSDVTDKDKARLIAQCDIQDGVGRIINYENDLNIDQYITVPALKVEGADNGLFHELSVKSDLFASGNDKRLVNYKSYHYMVLAYAYNEKADILNESEDPVQRIGKPFRLSVKNAIVKTAVPHKPLVKKEEMGDKNQELLDAIRIVPNPYYGFSNIDPSSGNGLVKITNIPGDCTINIFNVSGQIVKSKRINFDANFRPYWEWDLRNQEGLSVSSGVYIIHIAAEDAGEKVLKWFYIERSLNDAAF